MIDVKLVHTDTMPWERLVALVQRPPLEDMEVAPQVMERTAAVFGQPLTPWQVVERIVEDVRRGGDAAVADYARRLDGMDLPPARFFVGEEEFAAAYAEADPRVVAAIRRARGQHPPGPRSAEAPAVVRDHAGRRRGGQRYVPMERVAALVPGRPLPAGVYGAHGRGAGPGRGRGLRRRGDARRARRPRDPYVLIAAKEAGADAVLRVGGAHAVAALAYGTETIRAVDKIVGPGNVFTQLAKKRVFGRVGIDAIAGPSEILVLADGSARPEFAAADLLSQAEHDTEAAAWLVTDDKHLAEAVREELARQLAALPDPAVARASLERWGLIAVCRDMEEAVLLANVLAPEHLEVMVREPLGLLRPHPSRGRRVRGALHARSGGRLHRRPQPYPSHQRHGPLRVAAERGRLRPPLGRGHLHEGSGRAGRPGRGAAGGD